VPGEDLTAAHGNALGRDGSTLELLDAGGFRRGGQEAHLVAGGIVGFAAEGVAGDDVRELVAGTHEDGDVQAEGIAQRAREVALERRGPGAARQDDVAALEQRAHILVAGLLERGAQLLHGHAPLGSEVDPAQERDVPGHGRRA
jgi:hypothetical protein